MENHIRAGYQDPSSVIELAKDACGIKKPNSEMTDDEVRTTVKWVAEKAPDTVWADDKPIFGRMGVDIMLFITLTEFPWFYEKYGLSQFN